MKVGTVVCIHSNIYNTLKEGEKMYLNVSEVVFKDYMYIVIFILLGNHVYKINVLFICYGDAEYLDRNIYSQITQSYEC